MKDRMPVAEGPEAAMGRHQRRDVRPAGGVGASGTKHAPGAARVDVMAATGCRGRRKESGVRRPHLRVKEMDRDGVDGGHLASSPRRLLKDIEASTNVHRQHMDG
jgi:hypothetical protein